MLLDPSIILAPAAYLFLIGAQNAFLSYYFL